tara:strand:- start:1448 stop:2167 length:720 start_codon:yes stop_codon:yes gene_type:complete
MLRLNHLTGFGSGAAGIAPSGPSSYDLDGAGDYLDIGGHSDFSVASGDLMTIDFWMKLDAISNGQMLFYLQNGSDVYFSRISGNVLNFSFNNATLLTVDKDVALTAGQWEHYAVTKNADDLFVMYTNGVPRDSGTRTNSLDHSSGVYTIGTAGGGSYVSGLIDEYRHTKGAILFEADFSGSLPSAEGVSDSNTKLLIHGHEDIISGTTGSGATFTDSGNTGHTVTEVGNAIRNEDDIKF